MREELLPMLRGAAQRTADLVTSVPEEELGRPTPCSEFDVRGLVNHMEWAVSLFESVAGGGGFPPQKDYTGDFPERAERMLIAWDKPESWEGVSEAMGGLPRTVIAHMALTDLVAHGWDLSRATGRGYEVEEATAARLLAFARDMAPIGRARGAFGEEVAVPQDAPALERFLGLIGRDPAWRP
ncbi:TIGR03086 family metal-binding protein [Nonomuraea wenchangensis]|uniref:TIGR03086 family protein n=1 Tax=Nonomuraea wenchangensis TaxID=568860 RepID=A0A1I0LSC4_9ACTN|nr:TIGR03086 family metal-binding protein [Nonomuraea wenchangensis]SEU45579.1 TIGR03086 family protein [Nonomuraea wenchangensis]